MNKKLFSTLLVFAMCLTLFVPVWGATIQEDSLVSEQIDEAYQYPVQLRTPEWNALSSREERLAACQVDEALLEAMMTPALIETILNYPMLAEMYAFNSIEEGIEHVSADFYGITELVGRSDAISCLEEYTETAARSSISLREIAICYIQDLTVYIENLTNFDFPGLIPFFTNTYVYTPNGSAVPAFKNLSWADHGITYNGALTQMNELLDIYPNTTLISNPKPAYNCHSYAWWATSTSNTYWIDHPDAFMDDHSYLSEDVPTSGYKAYWNNGSHSAIVYSVTSGTSNPTLTSKWGALGVVRHSIDDCPYSGSVSYWSPRDIPRVEVVSMPDM